MKTRKLTHPLLNGGQETEVHYPITDEDLDNQISEIFESEHYGFVKKPGGVYVDIGANVGMATQYFRNWASKVYSVEPNPDIYEALVKNVGHFPDVKTFNYGIAHRNGMDFLYSSGGDTPPQTVVKHDNESSHSAVMVKFVSMDDFMKDAGIDHINLLKVDIEDAEYLVFPSPSFVAVAPKIDTIIGEAHFSINGGFPELIPDILSDYGFQTTFPKLKKPNMRKFIKVLDVDTGYTKTYTHDFETIFVAQRP